MTNRLPAALATLLFSSLVACSGEVGTSDANGKMVLGSVKSAVQGGKMDTASANSFAVGVANRFGGVCSGTLIAPNLVLTARHCVVPPSEGDSVTCSDKFPASVQASALYITTEPNLYKAKNYYPAAEIITPSDSGFCGNDIALIILDKSVPASEAQPAIPVVQFKMTDKRLSGAITALGYGITSPSAEDSGQRRIRENIPLLCIPGSAKMDCDGDMAKFSDDPAEFVTEGYVCSGDSGSGAFDQKSFDAGRPYVLGALSRGPQTKDRCLAAIYSRTDAHAGMIVDAGLKAAAKGSYPAPEWTGPEGTAGDADLTAETSCSDDVCTDTSATDPATGTGGGKTVTTTTGCSLTARAPGSSSTGAGSVAILALAVAGVFAARARARRVA